MNEKRETKEAKRKQTRGIKERKRRVMRRKRTENRKRRHQTELYSGEKMRKELGKKIEKRR